MTSPLEAILVERIERTGPMPFAAFMSIALYDRRHGYYSSPRPRVGWGGHFVTSPEIDPAFGTLWSRGFEEVWRKCGEPAQFEVVEVGPGEGTFAASVLRSSSGDFAEALTYRLVERSPDARDRQRALLADFPRIEWCDSVTEIPALAHGCVFANEVLDNLPVHLVVKRDGRILEICVATTGGSLGFVELEPSNPELEAFLGRCDVDLPEGHRFEIALAAESFVARVAGAVGQGAVILVDYGLEAGELAARPEGSLVSYSGASVDDRVLDSPGGRDITAHANWTAVSRACRDAGLKASSTLSQREVMKGLGSDELQAALKGAHDEAIAAGRGAEAIAALSRRQALGALTDPGGLGGLQVLVATREIETPSFAPA